MVKPTLASLSAPLLLLGLLLGLGGCAGYAFTPTGAPFSSAYTGAAVNHAITSNPIGAKNGEACAYSILGLVTIGDASVITAAHAAGITKIAVVDSQEMNIVGVYATHCIDVNGD